MSTTGSRVRVLALEAAVVCAFAFCADRAFAYGVYEEDIFGAPNEDAPELFDQAFPTPQPGEIDPGIEALEGYLDPDGGDFADMYCIYIGGAPPNLGTPYHRFTPEQFTVSFVAPKGFLDLGPPPVPRPRIADPQLFLFDAMGHPVVGNDDIEDGNLQASIPLGTITQSGVYILAVTGSGYVPTDSDLNELFTNNSTGLKTPTDATAVQAGWTGTHNEDGYYRLFFGVGSDDTGDRVVGAEHWLPEPDSSALLLVGLSGLALWHLGLRPRSPA